MGISLLQFFLPLALIAGGESQAPVGVELRSIDADIHHISLPSNPGTDGSLQFLVETTLPSDCYSLKPAAVRVNYERNVILFHIEATRIADQCLASDSRLAEVVTVATLPKGSYEIRNLKDLKVWGRLQVQDQISYAQNP